MMLSDVCLSDACWTSDVWRPSHVWRELPLCQF